MKKLLWIVPLVLIVVLATCSWFIGGAVEKNIDQAMKSIAYELSGSATPDGSFFTFTTKHFERGFLSSTATTEISLKFFENDEQPIVLTSKIYHGPLMFTADGIKLGASYAITTLDMEKMPADVRKDLEKGFDNEPPITIATLGGFGGGIESNVSMPYFRNTKKEDMGGMSTESKFQMAGMKMNFTVPGTEGGGAKGTMKTGEMKMTQTMQLEGAGDPMVQIITLGLGEGSFENTRVTEGWHAQKESELKFPALSMDFAEFGISLNDVVLKESMELDASGRKFDGFSRMSYGTGELTGPMAEEGAEQEAVKEMLALLKAGGLLEFTFEGVDAATLAGLEALMSDFMKSIANPMAAMEEGDDKAKDPDAAVEKLLTLFQPGLKFGIRQKLGEGEKRNEMALSFGFGGKPATEAETIGDFVNGLRGELSLRLSKNTVATTPLAGTIEGMIEEGMVEDRGDYYRSIGELRDGKVSLNGTELPVMDNFAPMMEAEFSLDGLMGVFMGMGGPEMGDPDMEGGFPDAPDGVDLPDDTDAKGASPDPLKPDAAPQPAPVPQ